MKKLVMSLSLLLLAVPLFAVQQTNCERNPHECVGPPGEKGEPGEPGVDGVDGKDGEDGEKGEKGDNGEDGAKGNDGSNGSSGSDGRDGKDGVDGKDADETAVAQLQSDRKKASSFATDAAAGNSAMASMDFGSIAEGETHGGLGIGVSKSWYGSSTAGAIGLKHGMTNETAAVIKVWSAGSNSYGGGAGLVHKF